MTDHEAPGNASAGDGAAESGGGRSRSVLSVAYTAATLIGGIAALVVLAFTVTAPDSSVLDVLLWGAIAVLLFAAAVREWWIKGVALDRSRRVSGQVTPSEIGILARGSTGEVETIRRLRQAHPGLGLVDAVNLVREQKSSDV